jgi:hypothetical protein
VFVEISDAFAKSSRKSKRYPMKTSTTLMLLALGAASLSGALTLPALAQTYKPRDQTCDNKSTARDKVQRPDSRCLNGTSEQYLNEQANKKAGAFLAANPPQRTTEILKDGGPNRGLGLVYDGVDRNGVPYRIVSGAGGGIAGSGSASGLGGNGGGRGRTSAR